VYDGKRKTILNRVRQIFIQDYLRAGVPEQAPVPVPDPVFKYCPTCSYHVQTDNRTQLCPDCKTECWELHGAPAQGKSYAHALLRDHFGPDYNNLHPEASDDKSLSEQVPELPVCGDDKEVEEPIPDPFYRTGRIVSPLPCKAQPLMLTDRISLYDEEQDEFIDMMVGELFGPDEKVPSLAGRPATVNKHRRRFAREYQLVQIQPSESPASDALAATIMFNAAVAAMSVFFEPPPSLNFNITLQPCPPGCTKHGKCRMSNAVLGELLDSPTQLRVQTNLDSDVI
jgi:hypothetical protein